jgi:hypothetical protein
MSHSRTSVHRYHYFLSALVVIVILGGFFRISVCFVFRNGPYATLTTPPIDGFFAIPSPVSDGAYCSIVEAQAQQVEELTTKDQCGQDLTDNLCNDAQSFKQSTIFDVVAFNAAKCLFESDKRRDAKGEHSKLVSSSTTNWINDQTAFALQNAVDRIKLKYAEERTGLDRDEASAWIRWMKSSPVPVIVDLSPELRLVANDTISNDHLHLIETTRSQFLSRLGARLILLPSGMSLSRPLLEPPASLIYGKLLYGGVTRYRRLVSSNSNRKPPRKAGDRTLIKVSPNENIPVWIQYGGAERMYDGVDIGSAAVLEIVLLPRGQSLPQLTTFSWDVVIQNLSWKPQQIFGSTTTTTTTYAVPNGRLYKDGTKMADTRLDLVSVYTPISQVGKDRNDAFQSDFRKAVGGLQPQIDAIVRRVLDGRVLRPAQEGFGVANVVDETATALKMAAMEAEELAVLGLTPVRGLLLYGPPGQYDVDRY